MSEIQYFNTAYETLTGHPAYPWQRKLFLEIVDDRWSHVVDLPTGSGKTSVLHVWLIALAWSLRTQSGHVPRRLAWVVNRRVVVDQTTAEVEALLKPGDGLDRCPDIRDTLAQASLSGIPLAVSTLRGQYADSDDWFKDPSTPAVVVGTVDMIGSRLLFRGYRSGRYHRPMHAGCLGVDTLIVNDESHLSPAFAELLTQMHDLKPAVRIPGKQFRVLLLSATSQQSKLSKFAHSPDEDAAASERFRKVYEAGKALTLHEVTNTKAVESTIWTLATANTAGRTVVFVEQPEKAAKLAARLDKDGRAVALLTGTMRGLERDALAQSDPVFAKFLQAEASNEPAWLVSTSAGEVGINLSCEHMITELVEADRLLQRFGRLNRFGTGQGNAHVVFISPVKIDRLAKSLDYLRQLDCDISCRNVWTHKPPADACSEVPDMARLEPRLIEIWAQTTYRDRCVPAIAPWLHGRQDNNAPEAELAWRADIEILAEWEVSSDQIKTVLDCYPVRPHERLREPAQRIKRKLAEIAALADVEPQAVKLIRVNSDRSVETTTLATVTSDDTDIDYTLLLLPDNLGNLARGMFVAEKPASSTSLDVADEGIHRQRYFIQNETWEPIGAAEAGEVRPSDKKALVSLARNKGFREPVVIKHPEDESKMLVYFGELKRPRDAAVNIGLQMHLDGVKRTAGELSRKVGLGEYESAFKQAGAAHDFGKRREVWQRAMGGSMEETKQLAKSRLAVNLSLINGYRHEFGSLVDTDCDNELVLHLIASHHRGGRPFFEKRQYDRDALKKSEEIAVAVPQRFARLQNEWGSWGLAYLEAVFKCADGLSSASEQASGRQKGGESGNE